MTHAEAGRLGGLARKGSSWKKTSSGGTAQEAYSIARAGQKGQRRNRYLNRTEASIARNKTRTVNPKTGVTTSSLGRSVKLTRSQKAKVRKDIYTY